MSAVILAFPRAHKPRPASERFDTLSRIRGMCIGLQLSRVDKAAVIQSADMWLDQDISAAEVERRARWRAEQLRNHGGSAA